MAFLTIAGIAVSVALEGAVENAPETIGTDSRAYSGGLRTTERAQKRNWKFTTKGLTTAAAEALRAACANGALVTCVGDALGDGVTNYTCRVTLSDGPYIKIRGGHRRVLQLNLRQV